MPSSNVLSTIVRQNIAKLWTNFSNIDRFSIATAARTARTGLYGGLAFGLIQDAISLARGRHLAYVDFLLGRNRYLRETNSKAI